MNIRKLIEYLLYAFYSTVTPDLFEEMIEYYPAVHLFGNIYWMRNMPRSVKRPSLWGVVKVKEEQQ